MQELRLVLIIVGALAIAALLLHGLWSSRKEKPAKFGEKPLGKLGEEDSVDADGFDQDGVGSVRVVNSDSPTREKASRKEPAFHFGDKPEADPLMAPARPAPRVEPEIPPMAAEPPVQADAPAPQVAETQPAAVEPASQQAPAAEPSVPQQEMAPETVPAPQAPVPNAGQVATPAPDTQPESLEPATEFVEVRESEQALSPTPVAESTESTPVASDLESDVAAVSAESSPAQARDSAPEPVVETPKPEAQETEVQEETLPPDYLVLNVHARHGEIIRGSELFRCLESNGLYYGENSVYHRHADPAGTGPVIYSVTNMVSPGHFPESDDPAFETPGVAFYLMLPCPGRADNNFNQMLQTAQRVADQLGADILDHERALITPHHIEACRDKAKRYTRA